MSLSQIVSGEPFWESDAFPGNLVDSEIEPDQLARSFIGQGFLKDLRSVATVTNASIEIEDV